jgi:hypothetical protein
MDEEYPGLRALDLQALRKMRTQLRGGRTRCKTALSVASSGLRMCEPGTREYRAMLLVQQAILEQQQEVTALLAAVEREVRKRELRGEEEKQRLRWTRTASCPWR